METVQITINFGRWVVDKNPNSVTDIKTFINDKGKEVVQSVKVPMILVQTGKQVMKIQKVALKSLNFRDLAADLGLNYISHSIA